jgi:hypothetical protein
MRYTRTVIVAGTLGIVALPGNAAEPDWNTIATTLGKSGTAMARDVPAT